VQVLIGVVWLPIFPLGTCAGSLLLIMVSLRSVKAAFHGSSLASPRPAGSRRSVKIAATLTLLAAVSMGAVFTSHLRRTAAEGDERSAASVVRAIWIAQENYKGSLGKGMYALSLEAVS
jgi:hypothetical protein